MIKGLFIFSVTLVLAMVGYAFHLDAFTSLNVTEEEIGPLQMMYLEQVGEYKQTGESIQKISKALAKVGIPQRTGFGIYKDDPDKVKRENLRSEAGVILADEDLTKVKELGSEFKFKVFEKTKAMVVKFPFKSAMSIFFGVLKAYPAIGKYANSHGYTPTFAIEMYEPKKQIIYVMPINNPVQK